MKEPIRYFNLGSEWLYFKLYMGSKTSEQFLVSQLKPYADQLLSKNVIDKWFFINYNDPNRHIRIRFHLVNKEQDTFSTIQGLNSIMKPLIDQRLLNEVMTGTYKRELERYGKNTIDEFESLFFHNSELIINILSHSEDDPEKRWLYGIKALDYILDDWGADLAYKHDLFTTLKDSYGDEMGINTTINRQLSLKFRANRSKINDILENSDEALNSILANHHSKTISLIEDIKDKKLKRLIPSSIADVLKSYIHMHCNRLFSTRQRMNEWVMYYFLHQYYRSKIARNKSEKKLNKI